MNVVSLFDYTPLPRFDNLPWTIADIQEAVSSDGPWVTLETKALVPLDSNPEHPVPRSFTTELATQPSGLWYRLVFKDANGDTQLPTEPILNLPDVRQEYAPSISDVGAILRNRTRNAVGSELGTFTSETTPTDQQVYYYISQALDDVSTVVGTDVPDALIDEVKRLTALRTAMYVELFTFPEQVAQNRSNYPQIKALYDEKVKTVSLAVASVEAGSDIGDEPRVGPEYGFPAPTNWLEGKM